MNAATPGRCIIEVLATESEFDEAGYLLANQDVAAAVRSGSLESGWQHFLRHGRVEGRRQRRPSLIQQAKLRKLARIKTLFRSDMTSIETEGMVDFLTDELRAQFNIVDTNAVSSNGYDRFAMELIERHRG